ncbi:tyrosine-type recombinase/integrase [Cellulosilyticum sp. WCF-2]|uniref:tyrosine-type recombinase/integrase n=1 Tax=Cellulosilyticum sp. WCF-2 TaxID=2497860 RepID=UPI001A9A9CD6|nr:tyrosine-type recombinase/integrase [Cellulosilyticum sp. WCF-2]
MMNKNFLSIVKVDDITFAYPTYEESCEFQTKVFGMWEQQQRVLGYTNETIALNQRNINEFLDIANKFIWEVTPEDFDKFYLSLVGRGLAYSTRRKYQSNIITCLDYLKARHSIELWEKYKVQVPIVLDKFNRHTHRVDDYEGNVIPPEPEVLNRFWDGLKKEMQHARKYKTVARDYIIFRVLELAGLRIYEAVKLDVQDCRFDLGERGKIHVRFGKGSKGTGHKARWVPMLNELDVLLEWYLTTVRPLFTDDIKGPLFLAEGGERINRDTCRSGLRRRQESLGFRDDEIFSPHQLRHAFATKLTESGVDLLTLKTLLGHADVSTTLTYANPGSEYLEKRIRLAQDKWRRELLNEQGED